MTEPQARPPIARRFHHAALEVRDMDKSIAFYREVFGMRLTERHAAGEVAAIPVELAFLRFGDCHHDIVLANNPNKTYRDRQPEDDVVGPVGIHHFAFEYADREAWEIQLHRLREMNIEIVRGPVVHSEWDKRGDGSWGENESFYILDPDNHRVELFCEMATIDQDGAYISPDGEKIEGPTAVEI
jgi:catechol 2,3-dioxygenase